MTITDTRSAFPPDVDSLMPEMRRLADDLGRVPGVNQTKQRLKVGAPKAVVLIQKIKDERPDLVVPHGALSRDPFDEVLDRAETPQDQFSDAPRKPSAWPLVLLALPAFVAVWSGWVGIGELTGFGVVHPFPGIPFFGLDKVQLNTAITLPIGFEAYAAYAFRIWLSPAVSRRTQGFARASVIASMIFGALGQITYHLMVAGHMTSAPWQITTVVACVPVAVCGMGFALAHLVHTDKPTPSAGEE